MNRERGKTFTPFVRKKYDVDGFNRKSKSYKEKYGNKTAAAELSMKLQKKI